MFACDLQTHHIGHDLTITVSGVPTGGIIESIGKFGDMVIVKLDGQIFNVSEDLPVTLTLVSPGRRLLTEPDPAVRQELYAELDARSVRA